MLATHVARAGRQSLVLAAIAGLHFGAFGLIASGLVPRLMQADPPASRIKVILLPPPPVPVVRPVQVGPIGFEPSAEPMPRLQFPLVDSGPPAADSIRDPKASAAGSGPVQPPVDEQAPALRTRHGRLAALVNSCYPSIARRMGEEGRAVARVVVDAEGRAAGWSVKQSSGFVHLDAAMDCVIRRLEFVAGRRDGRAVEATVLLPIVFRLD